MLASQSEKSPEPLKLACAKCIQGHRASGCKHQDGSRGPLYVIKRRGRPQSQCNTCREMRKRTGRHVRCICGISANENTPTTSKLLKNTNPKEHNADEMQVSSKTKIKIQSSPLSFENLLNPCQCQTNGICKCCSLDFIWPTEQGNGSCCGSSNDTGASTKRLEGLDNTDSAMNMNKLYHPTCNCELACACRGCLHNTTTPKEPVPAPLESNMLEKENCNTCVACDIELTGPSGIDQVDKWMESN